MKVLYWILAIALAVGLLYYSMRGVDWGRLGYNLAHANLALVAAVLALSLVGIFLRSFRWRLLLVAEGEVSVATAFWATCTGYFGNLFLPARAGELIRTFMISAGTQLSKTYVLTTALSERAVDAIVLVGISAAVLLTIDQRPGWLAQAARPFGLAALGAVIAIAIIPPLEHFWISLVRRSPLPAPLRVRVEEILGQVHLAIRTFHDPGRLTKFALMTAVIWTVDAVATVIGAKALGFAISLPAAYLLLAGLGLGSALPSTPGYAGIYQFVAVSVLVPFGFSRTDAITYILFAQVNQYLITGTLGVIGFSKYRRLKETTPAIAAA